MNDFDMILWRPIRSGEGYDMMLPKSKCQKTFVGEGYTDFSVNQMQEVVEEYSWQASELAQSLVKDTLQGTARAVHEFLYNYFQYKADEADQMLRSLACSWASRYEGIDCKSYSIAASSLLTEMGISHYIRRIKQSGYEPTEYTHVYVVVPVNQETADLSHGYYTIDGTIKTMNEPPFVAKDDLFMSGLKHYALNGTTDNGSLGFSLSDAVDIYNSVSGNSGSTGGDGGGVLDILKDIGDKVDSLFPSLMHGIKCLDKSAFDGSKLSRMNAAVKSYFSDLVDEMNGNLKNGNADAFSQNVAEYFAASKILVNAYTMILNERKWNGCSTDNLKAIIDYTTFLRDKGGQALSAYLTTYFNKPNTALNATDATSFFRTPVVDASYIKQLLTVNTATRQVAFDSTIFSGYDLLITYWPAAETVTYIYYTPKQSSIPLFQLTDYVAKNKDNFNAADYLKTLGKVVSVVYGSDNQNGNNTPITQDANTTQQAGFGVAGWLLLAAGASIAFSKMKDTGAGVKSSKPAKSTAKKPTVKKPTAKKK